MAKRFNSEQERNLFINEPRIASLMYWGTLPAPRGVPVWFEWDGKTVRMFAFRTSPKISHLKKNPNISVLIFNHVGEPEGWVAFDGMVSISDISMDEWHPFLDRVASKYWDLSDPAYAKEIQSWCENPESFVWLTLEPESIRSGGA
tara:strand:+ start:464 stop:901 length:438 start_codon:yes stop_codon:yes gene_type:complete